MFTLQIAREDEADLCYEILDMGRRFQREQGFVQWQEDYPTPEIVQNDIKAEKGYTVKDENGKIAAYMYIEFGGDEWYDKADIWSSDLPYAVMHRLAIHDDFRNMGLSTTVFKLLEDFCIENGFHYIRVDTMKPNKRMQHIFAKNGYEYKGEVFFVDGLCLGYDKFI